MELELFTVSIKTDGSVHVDFNEDLMELVTEEELKKGLEDKMSKLIPIVQDVVSFLRQDFKE